MPRETMKSAGARARHPVMPADGGSCPSEVLVDHVRRADRRQGLDPPDDPHGIPHGALFQTLLGQRITTSNG
jgi:hypothetical protein